MSVLPFERRVAYLTGYQENCGLNGLCHVIMENIDNPKIQTKPFFNAKLLDAFKKHYNDPTLDMAGLKNLLKGIKNPVHQEIVLGPVLRSLLPDAYNVRKNPLRTLPPARLAEMNKTNVPLTADEVQYLAAQFGVRVESYEDPANPNKDALGMFHEVEPKDAISVLRLSQLEGLGHWNRFVDTATMTDDQLKAHNAAFQEAYKIRHQYDYGKIQGLLTDAIKNKKDVNVALSDFEKTAAKTSPNPLSSIGSLFKGLFSGEGDILTRIVGALQGLYKLLGGAAPSIAAFGKAFSKQIDPNIMFNDEELSKPGAGVFKDYLDRLTGGGESHPLYKMWRDNPDSESTWTALTKALKQKGRLDDVNSLLAEREEAMVERNKDKLPKQYVEMIETLKKIDFTAAGDQYRPENLKLREQCFGMARDILNEREKASAGVAPDVSKITDLERKMEELSKKFAEHYNKAKEAQDKREKLAALKEQLAEVKRERELRDAEAALHAPSVGASGAPVVVDSKIDSKSAAAAAAAKPATPDPSKTGSGGPS